MVQNGYVAPKMFMVCLWAKFLHDVMMCITAKLQWYPRLYVVGIVSYDMR